MAVLLFASATARGYSLNDNLLDTLATHFNNLFFTETSENKMQLSEIINFGNGKARPKEDGIYPVYGGNGILSYTSKTNAKNVVLIGRVGAYCGSTFIEEGDCWVSDNAIVAKSIIVEDEYFDYFLLKKLDLYNHHVGTGQQLLTQGILNSLEVPRFNMDDIKAFNSNAKNVFKNINLNKQEINHLQDMLALILSKLSN